MRTEYLLQFEQLMDDANLPGDCQISYKSVFGAVEAYVNGHICMTYGKFSVV